MPYVPDNDLTGKPFLLTGALGCIGAWVARTLVLRGAEVTVLDVSDDAHRMRLIMQPEQIAAIRFIKGDITRMEDVEAALASARAKHIIHLAALQVPFCRADPPLGARVNVVGTVNVFEAARRAVLPRVVYASSVAVYGISEDYPEEIVGDRDSLRPRTHYGVYKQANEGTARIYWWDNSLSSIGLRPHTVYGPGRDQGMTSAPTKAMLAAAAGLPYRVGFGGRFGMQYARDVAETFVACALVPFEGAAVFNLRGSVVSMGEVVAAIESAEPSSAGRITWEERALPVPRGQDDSALNELLGGVPSTSLEVGVAESISLFRSALDRGLISASSE